MPSGCCSAFAEIQYYVLIKNIVVILIRKRHLISRNEKINRDQ